LLRSLKARSLGLATLIKSRAKQHSRLRWIRQGDANTNFFHLHANLRRKKHFIRELQSVTGTVLAQQDKEEVAYNFFNSLLGVAPSARPYSLDWAALGYETVDLSDLDAPFTDDEIKKIVQLIPSQRAPGPDGYIGLFYKSCWDIVKGDLVEALHGFYNLRTTKLHLANEANIVLLPKKDNALQLTDFRPISLINSLAKIITKALAERLAPKLGRLVSRSQNAFIKGRCIHDNFLYVQRVIRKLHKSKSPTIFIKLDISKAFDSVNWAYLLEVLEAFGFGRRWRNWISAILASSSSRILINGRLGRKIPHRRGLRQGDPLSPMLFILAIDPLQRIIERAVH